MEFEDLQKTVFSSIDKDTLATLKTQLNSDDNNDVDQDMLQKAVQDVTKNLTNNLVSSEEEFHKLEEKPKLSKNAPCPCGSGTKYKHCCLKK